MLLSSALVVGALVADTVEPRPRSPQLRYVEFSQSNGTADAGGGRRAHLGRDLLHAEEREAFIRVLTELQPNMTKLDSTDGLPAYEMYLRSNGVDAHPAAAHVATLEARIAPYLASTYGCNDCRVCTVLLRRYQASERLTVPSHFDRMAYVTAVASLNPAEFDGGLYLQRTPRADSREFFAVRGTDLVFHSYDLNHGVEVLRGTRYSAVLWISDSHASCLADVSPWYSAPAEAGSMDAQEALAELHALGLYGYARDLRAAAEWGGKAAAQGSAVAQSRLGRQLLAGEGVERDVRAGMGWVKMSAEQGYAPAMHTMGVACQYGDAPGGLGEAARWFELAADAGVIASQFELGSALFNGDGVPVQRRLGQRWLSKAAQRGHAEAKEALEEIAKMEAAMSAEEVAAAWDSDDRPKDEV